MQNLYSGGATSNQTEIARLALAKQQDELQAVTDRVTMDVRLAFYELLLNREKIHVREESVALLREELKSQRERLKRRHDWFFRCESRRGCAGQRRAGADSGADGSAQLVSAPERPLRDRRSLFRCSAI